jgi:hypothetical protein
VLHIDSLRPGPGRRLGDGAPRPRRTRPRWCRATQLNANLSGA